MAAPHKFAAPAISHAWCPNCQAIRPVTVEPLICRDVSGDYLGGDIVCARPDALCAFVIATLYAPDA
jgi:hypothetical protein